MDQNYNNDLNTSNNEFVNNQTQQLNTNIVQQPVMQETMQQPVPANPEPKKKSKIGLIIGIIVVIALVAGLIIYFLNGKDNIIEGISSNKTNTAQVEKMISENDFYLLTNYVDSYNKMIVKYPIFHGGFYESHVSHYGTKYNAVMIETILGNFNMVIHFPSDDNGKNTSYTPAGKDYKDVDDFFNSYYLPNAQKNTAIFLEFNGSEYNNFFYDYKDYKKVGDYKFNNINWTEYSFTLQKENNESETKNIHVWIMVHEGVPYVVRFYDISKDKNPFKSYSVAEYNLSDDNWSEIVDNADAIRQYIIKSISFNDDYEQLLNTEEASVFTCEGGWDNSRIGGDKSVTVPNCISGVTTYRNAFIGKIHNNNNKINISSASSALQEELKTYGTLKEQGNVYTLNNKSVGEYQVQKNVYVDEKNIQHLVYIICNNEIYGWIKTGKDIEDSYLKDVGEHMLINSLDFAVKNIKY